MHAVSHPYESLVEDLQPAQQCLDPDLVGQLIQSLQVGLLDIQQQASFPSDTEDHQVAEKADQLISELARVTTFGNEILNTTQRVSWTSLEHCLGKRKNLPAIGGTEERVDVVQRNLFAAKREHLLQQTLAIPHRSGGTSRN
jgi:hypothetical protein